MSFGLSFCDNSKCILLRTPSPKRSCHLVLQRTSNKLPLHARKKTLLRWNISLQVIKDFEHFGNEQHKTKVLSGSPIYPSHTYGDMLNHRLALTFHQPATTKKTSSLIMKPSYFFLATLLFRKS